MSRPLLALLAPLVALTLLAPLAGAQASPGGSLKITGLADAKSNQTQAVLPFTVELMLNQGTCVGGSGQFVVTLSAEKKAVTGNATVAVEVQPATLTFQVPTTGTLNG